MKPNAQAINSIIFDLDGTLINTANDVRLAVNHMLTVYGQPEITRDEIYSMIGSGVKVLVKKAFAKYKVELSEDKLEKAIACYLNFYKTHPVVETTVYPGVVDVLTQFKQAGMKLGICTNKPSVMTELVLGALNLRHFFKAVVASDEVKQGKPHELHIQTVLTKMNASHAQAVMVGDSEIDKQSAQNAGIPFIGVSYGYDATPLVAENIIHHFSELPAALAQINLGQILS